MADAVARRLSWYWPMEAGNAVLLPVFAVLFVLWADGEIDAIFVIASVACAALLVIGALYWRAVLMRMQKRPQVFEFWLPRLAAVETIALALPALAAVAVVTAVATAGWTPQNIASAVLSGLALLEYVNYYQIQLQHFDNGADLRRLLGGRGFRRAHMARDIAAWRARVAKRAG
jgi:hypothetical protein